MMSGENSHVGCWSPDHTSFLLLAQKKGANLPAGKKTAVPIAIGFDAAHFLSQPLPGQNRALRSITTSITLHRLISKTV